MPENTGTGDTPAPERHPKAPSGEQPAGASAGSGDTVPRRPPGPRGIHRFDLAAPPWLVELARHKKVPLPWPMMLRTGLAVPAGVAVGLATGHLSQGIAATMGAMATALVDRPGPLRMRLARLSCGFLGGAVGMTVGHAALGIGAWSILVFAVLAAVSGLVSVVNGAASVLGLQMLVQAAIATGMKLDLPSWQIPAWAATGAALTLLLTALTALVGGLRTPEREAVAEVYEGVAELLGAVGTPGASARTTARMRLVDRVNTAYDALLGARARTHGRSREMRTLAGLLNAATPLLDAVVAVAHTERPAPDGYRDCARLIAEAVRTGGKPPGLPEPEQAAPDERWPQEERLTVRELRAALETVLAQLDPSAVTATGELRLPGIPDPTAPPTLRERLADLLDGVLTGPRTWLYVARLTLCITAAEVLRTTLELERSYWMLLTVAIVLKPDFGSVFARAVQRSVGTLLGVLVAGGLLLLEPGTWWEVLLMALFIAGVPYAVARNYGMFTLLLTPFTLLLVGISGPVDGNVVEARLIDTLVGSAICLVLGFLLWPETWFPLVGRKVADAAEALAAYIRVAFAEDTTAKERTAARRRTFRKLSDVRTELQRVLAEPPALARPTRAWWPMLVQLERMADAVTYTSSQLRGRGLPADRERAVALAGEADELAAALRESRPPRMRPPADPIEITGQFRIIGAPVAPSPDPSEDPLLLVARELKTARRLATGPPKS